MRISKLMSLVVSTCLGVGVISCDIKNSAYAEVGRTVNFDKFDMSVNDGEVIRGVDVSSVIAVEKSGVKFYSDNGREQDIFKTLSEHGVNYIRVRVWNEPYDSNGHSYGGGNNDLETAALIGKRAAKYGMKLLVDIQYSDFWADPEKQTRPKYWSQHSNDVLAGEIYNWTSWVLKSIAEAGGKIGMVQVGNETNGYFCGEKDMYEICKLFASGNKAVRDFDKNILIAHHFANPSTGYYAWYAKVMDECRLDYDVFATSYYPYWHGTVDNMTAVLKEIANSYGKYVMVAETAYPYTDDDGDSFGNAVTSKSSGVVLNYDISPKGQAECIADVFQAVANVGSKGIGAFYWEPAWIGTQNMSYEQRRNHWNEQGSGWSTDYAKEYDRDAVSCGGSSYDNQALFDFSGKPLESLDVFNSIFPRKEEEKYLIGDTDENGIINVLDMVKLRKALFGKSYIKSGDMDSNGELRVNDLVILQNFLLGKTKE